MPREGHDGLVNHYTANPLGKINGSNIINDTLSSQDLARALLEIAAEAHEDYFINRLKSIFFNTNQQQDNEVLAQNLVKEIMERAKGIRKKNEKLKTEEGVYINSKELARKLMEFAVEQGVENFENTMKRILFRNKEIDNERQAIDFFDSLIEVLQRNDQGR